MSDQRRSESERRERAQMSKDKAIREGTGRPVEPREVPQMVSVRLDAGVLTELRKAAEREGTTVSDLLRRGAALVVEGLDRTPYSLNIVMHEAGHLRAISQGETSSSSALIASPKDVA